MKNLIINVICDCGEKATEKDLQELRAAWNNPGIRPDFHEQMKYELRKKWPVLFRAIVNLLQDGPAEPEEGHNLIRVAKEMNQELGKKQKPEDGPNPLEGFY